MSSEISHETTLLFFKWRGGDRAALDALMPRLEGELRRLARLHLSSERSNHSLQSSELVNEAYLRLINQRNVRDRSHFFALAARMMRRILVNYARNRGTMKRGGEVTKVPLEHAENEAQIEPVDLIDIVALNTALTDLERLNPSHCQVVELRVFSGMTNEETAEALDISPATAKRYWTMARAWLRNHLSEPDP